MKKPIEMTPHCRLLRVIADMLNQIESAISVVRMNSTSIGAIRRNGDGIRVLEQTSWQKSLRKPGLDCLYNNHSDDGRDYF